MRRSPVCYEKKTQHGNDEPNGGNYRGNGSWFRKRRHTAIELAMKLLKRVETLFQAGKAAGLSDGQLVDRFVQRRDRAGEAAFAALVDRHGAMVLRVCRQVLGDPHDAQDASQATFLVLARRAGSIGRRESVASWLHGVALRVAAKARQTEARRRTREQRAVELMAVRHTVAGETDECPERWGLVHDELGRLHASFREPLILCYLEGLTQEQAAAQLRCPLGTVQSRLARGRAKLKSRLRKRGFEPAVVLPMTDHLVGRTFPAPSSWAETTVRMASQFSRGEGSTHAVPGSAAVSLAEQVLGTIVISKLKVAMAIIFLAAVLMSGAAAWVRPEGKAFVPEIASPVALDGRKREPAPAPEQPAARFPVTRNVHGIVRDDQGRPVAKAWVGDRMEQTGDTWQPVQPADRIRERREPFRDEQGKIVPAAHLASISRSAMRRVTGLRFTRQISRFTIRRVISIRFNRDTGIPQSKPSPEDSISLKSARAWGDGKSETWTESARPQCAPIKMDGSRARSHSMTSVAMRRFTWPLPTSRSRHCVLSPQKIPTGRWRSCSSRPLW